MVRGKFLRIFYTHDYVTCESRKFYSFLFYLEVFSLVRVSEPSGMEAVGPLPCRGAQPASASTRHPVLPVGPLPAPLSSRECPGPTLLSVSVVNWRWILSNDFFSSLERIIQMFPFI